MTFSYGDAEHAIVVALDLAELPAVIMAGLSRDPGTFLKGIEDDPIFGGRLEPITLAEARQRIEGPLASYAPDPDSISTRLQCSRFRWSGPGSAACRHRNQAVGYVHGRRAGGGRGRVSGKPARGRRREPDVARFWAQVLTGTAAGCQAKRLPRLAGPADGGALGT